MLQKRDLVKQFELLTRQEIINHNREVDAFRLLVASLEKKLNEMEMRISQIANACDNGLNSVERNIEEIISYVEDIKKAHNVRAQNISAELTKLSHCVGSQNECISDLRDIQAKLGKELRSELHEQAILSHNAVLELHADSKKLSWELKRISERLESQIQQIRENPSAAQEVRVEVYKELSEHRADVLGVRQSLDKQQSQNAYRDKQIEDLYNQLKRLKR